MSIKQRFCVFLAVIFFFSTFTTVRAAEYSRVEYYNAILNTFGERFNFTDFMLEHAHTVRPMVEYVIDAGDYIHIEGMETRIYTDFHGVEGESVFTDEMGIIEWQVYIDTAGLYNISIKYFNYEGKSANIQRALFINGAQPFFEAGVLEFPRTWVNQLDYFRQDNRGNDLRPVQVEMHTWREQIIRDATGIYNEPFSFYFEQGLNTITFYSLREPMLIRSLRIHQHIEPLPYSVVYQTFAGLPRPTGHTIHLGGQYAQRRSSPMLAPQADNSGPGVYPHSARAILINNIGGYPWGEPGAWIEWDIYVPEAGLYHIALNVRQHFTRGASTYRRITINDEVPFAEMESVPFHFGTQWRVDVLGGDEPFLFWLNEGYNTIRMEAIMGEYAFYYREIQDAVLTLNRLYRQIIMITGLSPDIWRDYQINARLPHLGPALRAERERLDNIFESLTYIAGGRGERDAVIRNMGVMLTRMYEDVDAIPRRISEFRINIGALGTWLMQVREQRLSVGDVYVLSVDEPIPTRRNGFFARLLFELRSLWFSFFVDFNTIGDVIEGEGRNVTVWLGTGRDQAHVIRGMIDETFARETDINVTLLLVDMGALLPATLAGQGPDVSLMIGQDLPMNFGTRGAVRDISGFPGFDEVVQRFPPAAMAPFQFEDWTFALPETLTFNMLFYRRDILYEIGLTPPDTWDEVRETMSVLAQHHMDFGIPLEVGVNIVDFTFGMFLFQAGGAFYNEDGSLSALDSEIALTAFRDFTRWYTDYRVPFDYNFANRFRAGDMPMAIADYTNYNLLQVFAPEIRGLWGFRPIPGTVQPDGSINRTSATGGSAVVMMEQANDPYAAWEFMKWWTRADTQLAFGRGMESLMGAAARHPTANLEAFSQMPWPVRDYEMLKAQMEYIQGIPQVPGGYFTIRQLRNAFYAATTLQVVGPREALQEYVRLINDEIRTKRREFGLEVVY